MRYEPIGKEVFIRHRKSFCAYLKPRSLAILHSNDIMPTSADGVMPFVQDSDIFYLTGIDQEETILTIAPDVVKEQHREILFIKRTSEHIRIWEGEKLSKEEAREISGIETVYWADEFEHVLHQLAFQSAHIYLNSNEHSRASVPVQTRQMRFIKACQEKFPLHRYERIAPIMHELRAIKLPREVELMQQACRITEKGFRRVLSFIKPGVKEYEISAELIHEFVRNRSRGFAYTPILATGKNACSLHYITLDSTCQDGELVLMDFGAEYAGYHSDMTRTVPVNGRFTARQRQIYDTVLTLMRESAQLLNPSHSLNTYHKAVGELATEHLLRIGLLTKEEVAQQNPDYPAYKKYFMHGTSHYIGLNTHDYGSFDRLIEPGMVFTCEPGIYLPEEGLGVRLENNLLITEDGYTDLMADIPIEAEEIEDLMNPS